VNVERAGNAICAPSNTFQADPLQLSGWPVPRQLQTSVDRDTSIVPPSGSADCRHKMARQIILLTRRVSPIGADQFNEIRVEARNPAAMRSTLPGGIVVSLSAAPNANRKNCNLALLSDMQSATNLLSSVTPLDCISTSSRPLLAAPIGLMRSWQIRAPTKAARSELVILLVSFMPHPPSHFLEPGMIVENPEKPEWGTGQVQSVVGNTVTVNFRQIGKQTVNVENVPLSEVVK
jgi:hypothetical protein